MVELEIEDDYLEKAARAAISAGEHAAREIASTEQERKGDDSIVTEADREAEGIIRDELEGTDIPVLGEEFGGDVSEFDTYWTVDPIDGTQNYAYGQPFYGSAIGLVEDNEPVLGCFYMPEFGDLYYAKVDGGAYLNSESISVTEASDVDSAYVGLSGHQARAVFSAVSQEVDKTQYTFCAIQKGVNVGRGWLDACVYGQLYPWDLGPVFVIIREAGGVVTRVDSGDSEWDDVSNGMCVAGNPELVEEIRGVLSPDVVSILTS